VEHGRLNTPWRERRRRDLGGHLQCFGRPSLEPRRSQKVRKRDYLCRNIALGATKREGPNRVIFGREKQLQTSHWNQCAQRPRVPCLESLSGSCISWLAADDVSILEWCHKAVNFFSMKASLFVLQIPHTGVSDLLVVPISRPCE
jgi:hypothetical protein